MNKAMNNTLAAVAVAAAVGTGIYIANDTPAIVEPQTSVWKMPTIDLPELELPELTVAEFSIPSVNTDFCDLPTLTLPEITIDTAIVQNDLSKQFLTDSDMFETSELTVPELTLHISDFIGDAEKVENLRKLAIDQRNMDYSKHPYINDWKKIYDEYSNIGPVKYIPLKSGFRMITEVRMPENQTDLDNLSKNLKFYKAKGYNAALVCFRNGDDPQEMAQLVRFVKGHGLYVFFAFGGPENLNDEIFCNVDWFTEMLTRMARESHGFMPWRRSSLHLFYPDKAWNNFVHHTIRAANPEIYILGEIYYGMTALDHPKITWWFNIPENCSGIMLKNLGYKGFNLENIMKLARQKGNIPELPVIAVVNGERPYYATKRNNNRTFTENLDIKFQLENRFKNAGACGTITTNDDGSDGIYNKTVVNNLTKYIMK